MRVPVLTFLLAVLASPTVAQQRLPILDMHLHAAPAAALGPPPRATCTPMPAPAWDPGRPYREMWEALHK